MKLTAWGVGSGTLRAGLVLLAASSISAQSIPQLPDSSGWGVHVLALARAPDSAIWVGSYGEGIFVLRKGAGSWERIQTSIDTAAHSISFDFVNAFAFGPRGEIWYGTVGNGWGLSTDGGKTWTNWELRQLGPEWQYVAPNGIATRGDTTYIGTADGIKVTGDDGKTWAVITDSAGATTAKDPVIGRIQSQYVLALTAFGAHDLWVGTLKGLGHSPDGGRTWHERFTPPPCTGKNCVNRVRALLVDSQNRFWVGTEQGVYQFGPEFGGWKAVDSALAECARDYHHSTCPSEWPTIQELAAACQGSMAVTGFGVGHLPMGIMVGHGTDDHRAMSSVLSLSGDSVLLGTYEGIQAFRCRGRMYEDFLSPGTSPNPGKPYHTWFKRPIAPSDQPYIDQTYRFGSTMGGYFQAHQGVEFNNSDGTPVHAIGDGIVVYSGPAEAGANTVAIRHDRRFTPGHGPGVSQPAAGYVFSVYYHNTKLLAKVGDRVKAGDVIALVGNTGRATNDHLHLEVHVAPTTDSSKIVDAAVRYPPFNTNPELWIEPMPGTGLVAGQVWDSKGNPVQQTRIYGLVKPEPQETPFSYIETYGPKNHEDPVYHEHFAIGDVPAGEYTMGVTIEGKKVFRRVRVEPGKLTWVEFRPEQRH